MDFSTKAIETVSTSLAKEISMLIESEEIEDLSGLENGIREHLN